MQLEHSFSVPVGVEEAWPILIDIERIGPCMPGAAIDSVDGDEFTGTVKVKLGPINLTYKGKAAFVEKDAEARRAVIDARGRDARGNGTASAKITATLHDDGGSTLVKVITDLDITGKPAQFGRGVMVDVGNKLLGQFADSLAKTIRGPEAAAGVPEVAEAPAAASSAAAAAESAGSPEAAGAAETAGSTGRAPAKRTRPKPPTKAASRSTRAAATEQADGGAGSAAAAAGAETAAAVGRAAGPEPSAEAASAASAPSEAEAEPAPATQPEAEAAAESAGEVDAGLPDGTPGGAVSNAVTGSENGRAASSPFKSHHDVEPIDLLHHAGPAVAKRLGPLLAALIIVWLIIRRQRKG